MMRGILRETIDDLRKMLGISEDQYPMTNDFRRKVIEGPIKEINEAKIGVETSAVLAV